MTPLAVYIHWPFCKSKCPYCDFNSHVRESVEQERWRAALLKELDYMAAHVPDRTVTSIFFGGGTPSLMPADTAQALIERVHELWPTSDDIEITLEANPTSVEAATFKDFKTAGVNRVSLGIQSLRDEELKFLGREHSAMEALKAVDSARNTFNRYSFDLIYARPQPDAGGWEEGTARSAQLCRRASVALSIDHRGKYRFPSCLCQRRLHPARRGRVGSALPPDRRHAGGARAARLRSLQLCQARAGKPS